MKLSGFNFQDLNINFRKPAKIEEDIMIQKPELKKKKKRNFDFLFPAPPHNENMGLDDFGNKKKRAFEGVI